MEDNTRTADERADYSRTADGRADGDADLHIARVLRIHVARLGARTFGILRDWTDGVSQVLIKGQDSAELLRLLSLRNGGQDVKGYDFYLIEVPEDITGADERGRVAIAEAEEQSQLYAVPAIWTVLNDDGRTVIVKRERDAGALVRDEGAYKTLFIGTTDAEDWLKTIRARKDEGTEDAK